MNKTTFLVYVFGSMIVSYYCSGMIFFDSLPRGIVWGILHMSGLFILFKSDEDKKK